MEASSLRGLTRVSSTTSEDVLRFYQKRNKLTITRKPSPGFKAGKAVTRSEKALKSSEEVPNSKDSEFPPQNEIRTT